MTTAFAMLPQALHVAAARFALGVLHSAEIPALANDCLDRGLYTDALGRLYDISDPRMSEVGPLFERALKELGGRVPAKEEAAHVLLKHTIRCILEGATSPGQGAATIAEEVRSSRNLAVLAGPAAGDADDLGAIVEACYRYDELADRWDEFSLHGTDVAKAASELDEGVLTEAARWHRKYGGVAISPSWLAWNDGTVRRIAQAISDDRAFERLPILADALEDAGCVGADILGHCREPCEYVRGCWVIDTILATE
jgi:hypothetical protein